MSSSLPNIIQYFHDCYRSDNRELIIYDFLDRKVEDKVPMAKEELITGEYPIIPFESKKAPSIMKKVEVYEKEKELLYGSFFVCGHYLDARGEPKRLCAPLFYYPAEVEEKDEFHYLTIKATERRLNFPLISLLSKGGESDMLEDPLFKQLPSDYLQFEDIRTLVSLFQKHFPTVDIERIYEYPNNISLKSLKSTITKISSRDNPGLFLAPLSVLGLVAKSTQTRGVLNELSDLASQSDHSSPLKSLFNTDDKEGSSKEYTRGKIPMILSEAQQAILKSSSVNPISVIIGPPGTGKSYTIGAIAIEHMSRGESVLISSRTDEAVDVIANKLYDTIGIEKCIVRGGKKRSYSTPLNRYLSALLTRVNTLRYLKREFNLPMKMTHQSLIDRIFKLSRSLESTLNLIDELETGYIKEVENEIDWGDHLGNQNGGILDWLKTKYLSFKNSIQIPIWEFSNKLYEADKGQVKQVREFMRLTYVARVMDALNSNWEAIHKFNEALKVTSDTERLQKFSSVDFNAVLKAFPIWLTNLSEIKDVLPFEKELFDVVIIDEATQCDIASCIPLMQRGKRVVFAGDPSQLRHISFLSTTVQNIYKSRYNLQNEESSKLDFRNRSILDLAKNSLKSGDQVAMLDEHFRSVTPIISFSNQHFYDNGLRIMTSRPEEKEKGLYFMKCGGKRDEDGANQKEAQRLLNDVRKLVDREKSIIDELSTSIGILSPFRGQVDLLGKLVLDSFSVAEINKHKIRVGTAYSFQGEERDYMYLSFTVDKDSHHAAFLHINKEDVFNVSITRARNRQYIYLSINENEMPPRSLLRAYLSQESQDSEQIKNEVHDQFMNEVQEVLQKWKIKKIWLAFPIAGLEIDILVKYGDRFLGIDLVGYPGEFKDTFGIERFRVLNRAGIKVLPLPYSDWYFENEVTKRVLKDFIYNA